MLAQVKLGFTSAEQKPMIVTRSMQLTVQKSTRKFKTLECQLLLNNDGERQSISSRVAELDKFMPQYFGVSVAILENVIFCHQDESLWPMSEPTALKKKFDEIFEAIKYTKAIENLKNLRKAKNTQLGELRAIETACKETKDTARRVKKRSEELQGELEALTVRIEDLAKEMAAVNQTMNEKRSQSNKALGVVDSLNTKKERASHHQEMIDDLRMDLDELQESDEWLKSTLEQYEDRMAQYEEQAEECKSQYQDLQQATTEARRQMSSKQAEKGQQLAKKESYESQLQARVQLVKKAAHEHSMRGYDGELDDMQVSDFIDRVRKLSRDKDRELERIQASIEEELKQSQAVLTELESRRAGKTQDKVTAKQSIATNERKAKGVQQDLDAVNIDEGAKFVVEESRNDTKNRLSRETADYEAAAWDKRLQTDKSRLHDLESESERLRQELVQNTRLSKDRARLEFIKDQLKERKRSLDTLRSTYNDQLSSTLGADWSVDSVEREYQAVLDLRSRNVEDAKRQQEGAIGGVRDVEYRLKSLRKTLQEKKVTMKTCHDLVVNSIVVDEKPLTSIDDFESEFELLQKTYDEAKSELSSVGWIIDYYKKCQGTAEQGHCRLCERPVSDKKEKPSLIAKIQREMTKYATKELESSCAELEEDLQKAIAARSQYDTYKSLSTIEIPALEKEVRQAEKDKLELVSRLEHSDVAVSKEQISKSDVETLNRTVTAMSRYRNEISGFESEISTLSSQQSISGSSRSIEEIEEQNATSGEEIRMLKSKISKMVWDRDQAKGTITSLELELSTASRKLESAAHQLEKKQRLLSQIEDIRDASKQLSEVIEKANADLETSRPQLDRAKAQHAEVQQRGRSKAKDVQGEKEKLSETVHEFKLVEEDINRYLDQDGPGKLAACQRAIKNLEQEQKRLETESNEISTKLNEIKDRIADSGETKRSIVSNIKYRKSLRTLEALHTEIAELGSLNVTDDFERLDREATNAEKRYQKLYADRQLIVGSMRSKDDELGRSIEEYKVNYTDAGRKYRESHINVETTKAAVEDLGKCMQALDAAIMKYHSAKMEEINRVAGELWQSTYQGTDVDTIMIRSEAEEGTKKRGYNYRVVMVKQDTEMDMRGRCSAGQKVLACIILRLALAECFGVNCGVSSSFSLLLAV